MIRPPLSPDVIDIRTRMPLARAIAEAARPDVVVTIAVHDGERIVVQQPEPKEWR